MERESGATLQEQLECAREEVALQLAARGLAVKRLRVAEGKIAFAIGVLKYTALPPIKGAGWHATASEIEEAIAQLKAVGA